MTAALMRKSVGLLFDTEGWRDGGRRRRRSWAGSSFFPNVLQEHDMENSKQEDACVRQLIMKK